MSEMLTGISSEYMYLYSRQPILVSDYHRPYFLVFTSNENNIVNARKDLINKWKNNNKDDNVISKIHDIGEIEKYKSFWDFNKTWDVFKVYTKESYLVPEVSDYLFFNHGFYTAEHDIPYHQRSLIDLASEDKIWLYDTNGKKKKINCLIYDIETTEFDLSSSNIPIDIIGYNDFDIVFESSKNLDIEEFSFDIIDCPQHSENIDIIQMISRNIDEEIENLCKFCNKIKKYHIISGHNIAGFDNIQIHNRVKWILSNHKSQLSDLELKVFNDFIDKYSRIDKSFHFGVGSEVVNFYPCSFDTYQATRKFYPFLDSFGLKAVAPFIGVGVKDRIILSPSQIKIDNRTLKYNRHDVIEQRGVTLNLIQQALPLSFTTCMTFDNLLSSGAVNMWDHMAMIRGALQKKIMPPICRPYSISKNLLQNFNNIHDKNQLITRGKKIREQLSKEFIRVLKYGEEMPDWVKYPYVIYNVNSKDIDDKLNYHIPGGMTIKPDKDTKSHFIPWYHVIVADVGAMYPTILKAMNIGADTVRICPRNEKSNELIWLKKLPRKFLDSNLCNYSEINENDSFADKGYKLDIIIDNKPGVINCAMTGIMSMISKVKKELKEIKKTGDKNELDRLKMMYQSIKGARNAGTHGILSAPNVSGRQFNLWGAAAITTKGQMILADTLEYLRNKNIRVVYGDTDGIYLACSRSIGNLQELSNSLKILIKEDEKDWLSDPEYVLSAIKNCNKRWQKELKYPDFELEPEKHDCMIFVKHKNYLIFDSKNGKVEMITKGNNFKGSDKPDIARKILKEIMIKVIKENPSWTDEKKAREDIKKSITNNTKKILLNFDLSKVDIEDLTLIQSVKPSNQYKKNMDGSMSTFGKRALALEKFLDKPIKSRIKLKFVITKKHLPGISNPSKSGVKPIDYMYPVDFLKDVKDIDLKWYKKMIENYIQGAFGLHDIEVTEQKGLDAWM